MLIHMDVDKGISEIIKREYNRIFTKKEFVPGESPVPVSGKVFDEEEMCAMCESVLDGWWTEGRFCAEFERKIGQWLGIKHVALTNSGSSANLLVFAALTSVKLGHKRLRAGDEVITVANSFPTTVNPIIQHDLVPVFVDIDLGNYNASIESIELALTSKTKAIFLAHTLGNPFDIPKIAKICKKNNLWFIEDNCDALGSTYDGKKTGTFGHIATSSFYPAHHITTGEGGAVYTNNALLSRIIRSVRDWGRDCWCRTGKDNTCGKRFDLQFGELPFGYDHKYVYSEVGYNLKITEMQAALGVAQLKKLDEFIEKRKYNFEYLYKLFQKYENFFILPTWSKKAEPSWFGFLLTVKDGAPFTRDQIILFLNGKMIATRLLFAGNITKQPYFIEREIKYRIVGGLANTDKVMRDTFWIGCYPGIDQNMLAYVAECMQEFIASL